jgi:hypothetical protein
MENQVNSVESLIQKAPDDAKKMYMERVWSMTKDQLFHEVMRVQGESARMLIKAQEEIMRLHNLLYPENDDNVH